jgi:hypothetical protein
MVNEKLSDLLPCRRRWVWAELEELVLGYTNVGRIEAMAFPSSAQTIHPEDITRREMFCREYIIDVGWDMWIGSWTRSWPSSGIAKPLRCCM